MSKITVWRAEVNFGSSVKVVSGVGRETPHRFITDIKLPGCWRVSFPKDEKGMGRSKQEALQSLLDYLRTQTESLQKQLDRERADIEAVMAAIGEGDEGK